MTATLAVLHVSCLAAAPFAAGGETALFLSERHPDTIEHRKSYAVTARQVLGPAVRGGAVVYTIESNGSHGNADRGAREASAPLHSQEERWWLGEIPAQPPGVTVYYHFIFTNDSGRVVRHPTGTAARYSFSVLPAQPIAVTVARSGSDGGAHVRFQLRLRTESQFTGVLVLKRLSLNGGADPQRFPLGSAWASDKREPPGVCTLWDEVPDLLPGEIADFYFEISGPGKETIQVPGSAPAQCYSFKRPVRPVLPILPETVVTSDIQASSSTWLAFSLGGLRRISGEPGARYWGIARGLPSSAVTFVVPESGSQRAYVGTERGVAAVDAGGSLTLTMAGPTQPLPGAAAGDINPVAWDYRPGPAACSDLDGGLFFQIQRDSEFEQVRPRSKFLEWRDEHLTEWRPSFPLASVSAVTFDGIAGCWLLGGLIEQSDSLKPALIRRSGAEVEIAMLKTFTLSNAIALPQRIVAIARHPETDGIVLGLEFTHVGDPQYRIHYGVFTLSGTDGAWTPTISELADITNEVTVIATDWPERRILIGTAGRSVMVVRRGAIERLTSDESLPHDITAVRSHPVTGMISIASTTGGYQGIGRAITNITRETEDAAPPDALPSDMHPREEQVLLSSYTQGLAEWRQDRGGEWKLLRRLRPGHELPAGLYGEARYTPAGEIMAIVHSQGLLHVRTNRTWTMLRTNDGLYSAHLLNLLVCGSGDVWIAHTPFTGARSGGAVQLIRDGKVVRTVPIPERDLATISRWIELPGRHSIIAATRSGIAEIAGDGTITILARESVSSLTRGMKTNVVGFAGHSVLRWDGATFSPFLFQINHPRMSAGRFFPGVPIDVAIDERGIWHVLFRGGYVAFLNSEGAQLGLLDSEDGIPSTARRILVTQRTGDVFIGSSEGVVVIRSSGGGLKKGIGLNE